MGQPAVAQPTDDHSFPSPAYAWYVVVVIFIAYTFAFVDRIVVAIVTPAIQADLGLNDSQAGLLQGLAFALFYTVFGLPLGWLTDRWSRKWLLTIGMAAWSAMTAFCGLTRGFGWLFVARLGVGMGEGCLNPCTTSLIGDYFPPRTRSRAFGVYVMATAVGVSVTYLLGGIVLKWLIARGGLDVPLFGPLKPWQAMFVLVGVPGLIPALLFILTVREPRRHETATTARPSVGDISRFIAENRLVLFCHHAGISLVLMSVYAYVNWMPTFFLRVHGWEPQRFSVTYGAYSVFAGIFSALTSGWAATWLKDRGFVDGTLRACAIGSAGSVICAIIAPLMPTPESALFMYVFTGIFVNYPSVLGLASIAEIAPNQLRGMITAIYIMIMGLLSAGIGPFAVGVVTDYVLRDKAEIGLSLVIVSVITGVPGVILLAVGLKPYRASLARARWITPTGGAR